MTEATTAVRSDERTAELRAVAEAASAELAEVSAGEALAWALRTFGDRLIVASNMQDAVLVDLAVRELPPESSESESGGSDPGGSKSAGSESSTVDVLFLETGYHFAETIGTRDAVATVYPRVRIVNAEAEQSVADQEAEFGLLNRTDPNRCCFLRKVVPLQRTLANYDAWVTGVRRVDAPTRANTPIVQWDDRNGLVKINPIAAWTDDEFNGYIAEHGILQNPLVDAGYPSIGCAPCTQKPSPGADPRSGRWAGQNKTECGLHG